MKDLGILVPIVTPCAHTSDIDIDGLGSVCDDMLEAGCSSIFVAGSTGRGPWFNMDERVAICRTVADHTKKKTLLFAGCMASGLKDMLNNAHAMADAGADIAVVTAPGYFNYNQNEVERIFLKFADSSPLPVLIYDIPVFAGMKLDIEMVIRLSEHKNVVGFKDSSSDSERFKKLINTFKNSTDFYLLQGKEHLLKDSLIAGASGLVVGLLHIDPRPFVSLYRAVRSNNINMAERMQNEITKVMYIVVECFDKRPENSTLFHFLNCCLKERGICENIMMEFEGDCPDWIAERAREAANIFKNAAELEKLVTV